MSKKKMTHKDAERIERAERKKNNGEVPEKGFGQRAKEAAKRNAKSS